MLIGRADTSKMLAPARGAFKADPEDFMSVADNPNREGLIKLMSDIQQDYERYKK